MLAPNNRKRRSPRSLLSAGAVIAALVAAFFLVSPGLNNSKQAASYTIATTGSSASSHNTNKSKISTVAKDVASAASVEESQAKAAHSSKVTTEDNDDDDHSADYDYKDGENSKLTIKSDGENASLHKKSSNKNDDKDYDDSKDYKDYKEEEEDDYKDYNDASYDVNNHAHSVTTVKSGIGPTISSAFERSPSATTADDDAFLKKVAECSTHECITEAHKMPRSTNIFNFPHFMIIGFQKSATTSLFKHLQEHPDLLPSIPKEPNYFSYRCNYNPPEECDADLFPKYLDRILVRKRYQMANGTVGVFEGSTHYLRGGVNLVRGLREMMPWLKLIINIREPISRAASMLIHNRDSQKVGCLMRGELGECLLRRSQINGTLEGPDNYYDAVRPWFEEWPAEQIHVIQYEELTEDESEENELIRVKRYLGIDEKEPKGVGLGLFNVRRFKIRPEGWKMPRLEYETMLKLVKPDTEALINLLDKYGKIKSKDTWLDRWKQVWDDNLKSCNDAGVCNILLS
ncbi:hypothetical protein Ndes2526B_g04995 [Nannochloris sp. 'desiccata']